MASRQPPKGRRTSTGAREVHVTVTRDRHGRRQTRDTVSGQYASIKKEDRRQADLVDRVDQRLKWGKQAEGWWYIPPRAGGTHNWVRQQSRPTVIRGYLYKPGRWYPHTTPENPGTLGKFGPNAPYGTPYSSIVPWDVKAAAGWYGRAAEPSGKSDQFKSRRYRVTEGYTNRYRTTKPKKKK